MDTELTDKVVDLARQLSYAQGVKEAARLRIQCDLDEWAQVVAEAKRLHASRVKPKPLIPAQRAYRA